jgi:MSHA pilin protein MshC
MRSHIQKLLTADQSPMLITFKSQRGYTLVELIIVIIIIGIMAVSVMPRLFTLDAYNVAAYNNEVLNSIRYAQKIAIGTGCDVQVSHTSNSLTINMRQGCTAGAFNVNVRDPATNANSYVKQAPSGVLLSSSGFPIRFDRIGRAYNSSSQVVNLQLQVGSKIIKIIGETGYAYNQ